MRYSNVWPETDKRPVRGIPAALARTSERGVDYGAPVRVTTVANISRDKTAMRLRGDKPGKFPRG